VTQIVGIVNVTPDSFSDGGRFLGPERAIAHARALVADGAAIIDLGPSSSRPGSTPVPPDEEIRRIAPVLDALVADGITVSLDSFQPATQRYALAHGAALLNDIHGFPDPTMYPELARDACRLVVMHRIVREAGEAPATPKAVLAGIERFFAERVKTLTAAGIDWERLILDPGMGFFLSTDPEVSLAVLRALPALRLRFGRPLLVSVSRKAFLRTLTGRDLPDIGPATLAAELYAAAQGADYIRTHDVRALRDALVVQGALRC
jgi:dihydropteroate synthase type 2